MTQPQPQPTPPKELHMPNDYVRVRFLVGPNAGKMFDNYTRMHATFLEARGAVEILPPEETDAPTDGDASGVRKPATKPAKPTRTKPARSRNTKSK